MSWWQQVPVLSQRHRCITIDQRTFGLSRDVKSGPGRKAFVGDLKGLLEHLASARQHSSASRWAERPYSDLPRRVGVGLEMPILALNRGFGNVAHRQTSTLR